jgi:tetratricopeptide (TPR) repeat protein
LRIPENKNFTCSAGRKIGATDIQIKWNAPGVKGREGKIWGTDIVPYGFTVLGFGSNNPSPWRAGADECTTISFSTDVKINGTNLAAGKYGFFVAVYPDSCVLIFNKNTESWGSYFYNKDVDVLHVTTKQQKNITPIKERLEYNFSNQKEDAIEVALEWEHWRIPFTVSINLKETVLADIQKQLTGAIGFDPASLEAGANWCLTNNVNFEQALGWINAAIMPDFGGRKTFNALNTKANLLEKLGKADEAKNIKQQALEIATAMELHSYGRSLLAEGKKEEALKVFEMNYTKNAGAWPTNMGMMRAYSALGNYKKALEHAKKAIEQAPDEMNKKNLKSYITTLEKGEPIK